MLQQHNTEESNGRQFRSADVFAPPPVNQGRLTKRHPNRFVVVGNTAILFCRSANGMVFGVRIDADDLVRVLKVGTWRIADFNARNNSTPSLYAYSRCNGKFLYLHRFILDAPPKSSGLEVDHRFNRTMDNRKSEIRLATKSLNQRNKRSTGRDNAFGLRGVGKSRNGNRFIARVWINSKSKQLGTFDTPELAGERVRQYLIENGAMYAAGVKVSA